MTLSMPATLQDALNLNDCVALGPTEPGSTEYVEVDGDHKAIILWAEDRDGIRSVLDLYFWE